jgi:hypothetical protein
VTEAAQASPVPRDTGQCPIRRYVGLRVRQGFIRADEAPELIERLELIASLQELGAVSPRFAEWLIDHIAQEQAELWLDHDGPAPRGAPVTTH